MSDNSVPSGDQKWYLAQLKPGGLNQAITHLERQDISVFLPTHELTTRKNGRFVSSRKPLFPGYLFVAINELGAGFRAVNNTRGVSKLVSFGKDPALVPIELIEALKSRCDQQDNIIPYQKFSEGDTIKLVNGPFSDLIATVDKVTSEQRIWLLLDVLGRTTRISVDQQSIRNVE